MYKDGNASGQSVPQATALRVFTTKVVGVEAVLVKTVGVVAVGEERQWGERPGGGGGGGAVGGGSGGRSSGGADADGRRNGAGFRIPIPKMTPPPLPPPPTISAAQTCPCLAVYCSHWFHPRYG